MNTTKIVTKIRTSNAVPSIGPLVAIALAYSVEACVPETDNAAYCHNAYKEYVEETVCDVICDINELQVLDCEKVMAMTKEVWMYRANASILPQWTTPPVYELLDEVGKVLVMELINIMKEC